MRVFSSSAKLSSPTRSESELIAVTDSVICRAASVSGPELNAWIEESTRPILTWVVGTPTTVIETEDGPLARCF